MTCPSTTAQSSPASGRRSARSASAARSSIPRRRVPGAKPPWISAGETGRWVETETANRLPRGWDRVATVVGFAAALAVLSGLVWLVGIGETLDALATADPRRFSPSQASPSVARLVGAALWTVLRRLRAVAPHTAVLVFVAAAFSNNITPFGQAGGEPVTALLISRAPTPSTRPGWRPSPPSTRSTSCRQSGTPSSAHLRRSRCGPVDPEPGVCRRCCRGARGRHPHCCCPWLATPRPGSGAGHSRCLTGSDRAVERRAPMVTAVRRKLEARIEGSVPPSSASRPTGGRSSRPSGSQRSAGSACRRRCGRR
ncbi:hypothetical protein C9J85_16015 [Haloferax sp. wsp5]|nr:hypothetical protein C9J85_16015 [Haloferax sp. wsp5]